jgi:hypothetical protein
MADERHIRELLDQHNIFPPSYDPGRYYLICPQCSSKRKPEHRKLKPLGVTITTDNRAFWGCNHCSWKGPQKGEGVETYVYPSRVKYKANGKTWWGPGEGEQGLFRIHECLLTGGVICIVEGEKDANSLWKIDIAATCAPHGATVWKPEYSQQLRGRTIIVFNDNDEPGYAYAKKVVECSTDCASVHRIDLKEHWADMPHGADVSDFIALGADHVDLLKNLIDDAAHIASGPGPLVDKELPDGVTLADFLSYLPQHQYIFRPTGQLWPAASVNGKLPRVGPIKPSSILDANHSVEQMTWAPGQPTLIENKLIADGGWVDRKGVSVFNLYRPPNAKLGNASNAQQWIDHVEKVYPDDAGHIIKWLAHRCQYPEVKINHALLLGGAQGIGKDTLLEPIRRCVGYWNCASITPTQLVSRFNSFLKSIILVVPEARDLGEVNRPNFYEHCKIITASPPEVLLIDEKHTHPYYIPNVCGVIITTNHKTSGIYLPAEDRRHYVAWSPVEQKDFADGYWRSIWSWYERGGYADIAAYLMELDLSSFNPKAPPMHTAAFEEICMASIPNEAGELEDALANIGNPDVVWLDKIIGVSGGADADFAIWAKDRRNRRMFPRFMELCGYVIVKNPNAENGLWRYAGKKQMLYARASMTPKERAQACWRLCAGSGGTDQTKLW